MTGVVLAGGASRRMGTDKALLDWHGRALVDHVAARIAPVCARVLIASGDGRRLRRAHEIADAVEDAGPLGGLLAALESAVTPLVAAVAVDMPDADPAVLGALAESLGDADAGVPLVDGRLQPLHAVYRTSCAAPLRTYLTDGGRSMTGFLDLLRVSGAEAWKDADPAGRFAQNLNTPADVAGAD